MSYVDPATVIAPKSVVRSVHVVYDGGSGGSSVALLDWEGQERVGIRWNGEEGQPGIGNPQSHGQPTWFVVPDELGSAVLETAEQLSHSQEGGLLASYREMANDREREAEAREWSEALIGDANDPER
ncbi:MAG TPA: hypothetical protein VIY49_12985 [Bryobacteraceae bacterium]